MKYTESYLLKGRFITSETFPLRYVVVSLIYKENVYTYTHDFHLHKQNISNCKHPTELEHTPNQFYIVMEKQQTIKNTTDTIRHH